MNIKLLSLIACFLGVLCLNTAQALTPPPAPGSKTLPTRTDADVARAVKAAFAADKFIANESVGVSVQMENGVATLTGIVASEKAKNDIGAKARSVGGVRQVNNNLQVRSAIIPRSPDTIIVPKSPETIIVPRSPETIIVPTSPATPVIIK